MTVDRFSRRQFLGTSLGLSGALTLRCGSGTSRPNLLLITLDTTRADRLGCYGYRRPTSPALDSLADRSTFFETAIASSSWTLPAHASLFTGKLSKSHGARYDPEGPLKLTSAISGPSDWEHYRARGLTPSETTLAAVLDDAGYQTAAVVGGPWMRRVFGLDRGFDYYDDDQIGGLNGRLAEQVTTSALSWVDARNIERPFFLFLNYYDPHAPYGAPEPHRQAFLTASPTLQGDPGPEELSNLYDGEIAYMDGEIERLLKGLDDLGLTEETVIAVTSDHGELLGEHGELGHGNSLYQEEIRIPLFVKPAGAAQPQRRVSVPAHQIDVMPVVLSQLGIDIPATVQGLAEPKLRPLVSEVYPLPLSSLEGSWQALLARDFKLLKNSQGRDMLFNLALDPHEKDNLIEQQPETADRMSRFLTKFLDGLPEPGAAGAPRPLDPQTEEALRSLGYIQ